MIFESLQGLAGDNRLRDVTSSKVILRKIQGFQHYKKVIDQHKNTQTVTNHFLERL